jgi:hypothetical protein
MLIRRILGDASFPWCQICYDPASMQMAGTGMSIGGKLFSGYSSKQEADRAATIAQQGGEFEAQQHERAAGEDRAQGQRNAIEQQMRNAYVISAQRANAAASGAGGVETPGLHDIIGDTMDRGKYLVAMDQYAGAQKAASDLDAAAVARAGGANQASMLKARGNNAFYGSVLDAVPTGLNAYANWKKRQPTSSDPNDPSSWNTTVSYANDDL